MHTNRKLTTAHAAIVLGVSQQRLVSTGQLSLIERTSSGQMVWRLAVVAGRV